MSLDDIEQRMLEAAEPPTWAGRFRFHEEQQDNGIGLYLTCSDVHRSDTDYRWVAETPHMRRVSAYQKYDGGPTMVVTLLDLKLMAGSLCDIIRRYDRNWVPEGMESPDELNEDVAQVLLDAHAAESIAEDRGKILTYLIDKLTELRTEPIIDVDLPTIEDDDELPF